MSSLAADLAFDLGGDAPDSITTPGVLPGAMDHITAALDRLPQQFRAQPKIRAMLSAFVGPCVSIENTLYQMLTQRGLDFGVGVQLDTIGVIVGQLRGGLDDATYKVYLRTRIAANRSRGTVEDLLKIANLVLLDQGAKISIETIGPGSVEVRITSLDMTDGTASTLIGFLRLAVGAGIRLDLVSSPVDTFAFTTAGIVFSDGTLSGAYTTVHGSTTGDVSPTTTRTDLLSEWPITGSLRFETNTPNQEVIAYTSRVLLPGNQNIEFQLAAPMALIHGQFSPLELVITSNPGLGDSTDPGQPSLTPYADVGVIGGRMADVRE